MAQNPSTRSLFRVRLIFLAFALGLVSLAQASDCLRLKAGASAATLRTAPASASAALGTLDAGGTAPFIAMVPRWYEARTSAGQPAFVSKALTEIVTCPATVISATAGADTGFELHAIDVGTGLAIFVRGPDFTLLFDAGSNDDLALGANNRAVAYLKSLEFPPHVLNHVFLSHPHRDHVELLPDVMHSFEVKEVWNSGAYNDICGYRHFLEAVAASAGVNYHTATQGEGDEVLTLAAKKCYGTSEPKHTITLMHAARIDAGTPIVLGQAAKMTFLHADGSKRASFNENSLVVRLDLATFRVLLMGDAEAGGRNAPTVPASASSIEGQLLACCIDELKADVLVVGHHGSKTSSRNGFIDAVGAKVFIISSGPTRYGSVTLPDAEIVSELEGKGTLFRTDLEDEECAMSSEKVGPDEDGKAGGCDNVVVQLKPGSPVTAAYSQRAD